MSRLRVSIEASDGSAPVSYILVLPALMMLLQLVILGARITTIDGQLSAASREGARAASLARTSDEANQRLYVIAQSVFERTGALCPNPTAVFGPATEFEAGGRVEVVMSCEVPLDNLGFLPVPGSAELETSFVEPIDYYREVIN